MAKQNKRKLGHWPDGGEYRSFAELNAGRLSVQGYTSREIAEAAGTSEADEDAAAQDEADRAVS